MTRFCLCKLWHLKKESKREKFCFNTNGAKNGTEKTIKTLSLDGNFHVVKNMNLLSPVSRVESCSESRSASELCTEKCFFTPSIHLPKQKSMSPLWNLIFLIFSAKAIFNNSLQPQLEISYLHNPAISGHELLMKLCCFCRNLPTESW